MEKIKEQIATINKWNVIKNDQTQQELINKLDLIEQKAIENLVDYELQKAEIAAIQKVMNKFNTENVKPIKQALAFLKDKVLGEYEKQTINRVKQVKKDKEQQAIEAGIIEKKPEPVKLDLDKELVLPEAKVDHVALAIKMIVERLATVKNENEKQFLEALVGVLQNA